MSKQTVISALIRLVTVHGLPFAAVEWEAVRDLTQPVLNVFKTVINRRNIVEVVDNVAAQIACLIAEELKGSRISLKLDIHTAENLLIELVNLLLEYNIPLSQVASITIDNGANVVKLTRLASLLAETDHFNATVKLIEGTLAADESGYDQAESGGRADEDELGGRDELGDGGESGDGGEPGGGDDEGGQDDLETNTQDGKGEMEEQIEQSSRDREAWIKVLENMSESSFILPVRCGAHTAQLVVHDVCKLHKSELREIRTIVKKVRQIKYKAFFDYSEIDLSNCFDFIDDYVEAF
ncbi:hypothetical protein quinque_010080 [Culex quinquefasciatus]